MSGHCKQLKGEGHLSQQGRRYKGKFRAGEVFKLWQAECGLRKCGCGQKGFAGTQGWGSDSQQGDRKQQGRTQCWIEMGHQEGYPESELSLGL